MPIHDRFGVIFLSTLFARSSVRLEIDRISSRKHARLTMSAITQSSSCQYRLQHTFTGGLTSSVEDILLPFNGIGLSTCRTSAFPVGAPRLRPRAWSTTGDGHAVLGALTVMHQEAESGEQFARCSLGCRAADLWQPLLRRPCEGLPLPIASRVQGLQKITVNTTHRGLHVHFLEAPEPSVVA